MFSVIIDYTYLNIASQYTHFFLLVSIFINPHVHGRVACRHSAKPKRIEWLSFFVVYLSCDMMLTCALTRGACSQWLVSLPPLWCCSSSAPALGSSFVFWIKYSKQVTGYMLWWQMGLFNSWLWHMPDKFLPSWTSMASCATWQWEQTHKK